MHDLFTRGVTPDGHLRPTRQEAPHLYHPTLLGWLPKEWDVRPLSKVCDIRGRVGWKGYTVEDLRDSGPLVLGAAQISKLNRLDLSCPVHISTTKYLESPEIMVSPGDVLVVQRGTIGKIVFISEEIGEATINPSMILLTSFRARAEFVFNWLCSYGAQRQIGIALSSTGVPMISQKQTGEFLCPVPDSNEQDRIAKRLAAHNEAIVSVEESGENLRQQKQGLMQDLLTGRVPVKS